MVHPALVEDSVKLIQELNRMFLCFLQRLARSDRDFPGMSPQIATALRRVEPTFLEIAGSVPRALFTLSLTSTTHPSLVWRDEPLERARLALNLTVLYAAWNAARQSDYQARLLFGLDPPVIRRLRTLGVSDLAGLAHASGLLGCAFVASGVLWERLLRPGARTVPKALTLIALQPAFPGEPEIRSVRAGAARRLSQ